jgi:hypothetical protein
MRVIGVLADRLVGIVAPRVTAAALSQTCWFTNCFCTIHQMWARYCCIANGRYSCTPCQWFGTKC